MYKLLASPIRRRCLPNGLHKVLSGGDGLHTTDSILSSSSCPNSTLCGASNVRRSHSNHNNNQNSCHYEVLNVAKDSTAKEIRDAFVRLSKQYHPDHSKDVGSSAKFQRIMEAYRILSKVDTRSSYDNVINAHPIMTDGAEYMYYHRQKRSVDDDSTSSSNYYGVEGMKKKSNYLIVWSILGFAAIGVFLQMLAIKSSFTFKRDQMDQTSMQASKWHSEIREEANQHDRADQLNRVLDRMKST